MKSGIPNSAGGALFHLIDFRFGVLLSCLLMPLFFHPLINVLRENLRFNLVYWVILLTFCIFCLNWLVGTNGKIRLFNKELYLLFLLPYSIAVVRGFAHVDDIVLTVLSTSQGEAVADGVSWYVSSVLGALMVVAFALATAGALRTGLQLRNLLVVAAIPLWFISLNLIFVVAASGISLSEWASPDNRHLLLDVGFGAHGNTLGVLFTPAFALYLGVLRGARQSSRRMYFFVALTLVLLVLALLLTFSRAAYVTALAVIYMQMRRKGNILLNLVLIIAAFASFFLLPDVFIDRFLYGVVSGDLDEIFSHRISGIWEVLYSSMADNPIFGYGSFYVLWSGSIAESSGFLLAMAHNAFLDLMLEMGGVGLVLVVGYYVHLWSASRRLAAGEPDPLLRGALEGVSLSVFGLLLVNVVGERITPEPHHFYFWLGVGIFLASYQGRALVTTNVAVAKV